MRSLRLLVALSLALAFSACVQRPEADASGREIFVQVCARCHGTDLSGGVGPALGPGSNAASQPDEFLTSAISEGRGTMPSFAQTLTPQQIDRVVVYLRQSQAGDS